MDKNINTEQKIYTEFSTIAIHAGQPGDESTGAVIPPLHRSSTYQQEAIGRFKHEYSRTDNPTRLILEKNLAAIEHGNYGLAFASGSAASHAIFSSLRSGNHIIIGDDTYGGTYRQLEKVFDQWGLKRTYVKVDEPQAYAEAINKDTKLIWAETPTNPLLKLVDLRALSKTASTNGILLAVDNTFASPYFQKPLLLGAHIVVHSLTKYINGHSDVVGGAVVTSDKLIYERIRFFQNTIGSVLGPDDSALVLRSIKTLEIRMERHQANAIKIAEFLSSHPLIEKVYYPGLANNQYHELAKKQMTGFGGMVSIELSGGRIAIDKFLNRLKIFKFAESLGGVESLICYPPAMTHGSIPEKERLRRGIKDNLLRLSVGIEGINDLINDLDQALSSS